MRTTVLMLAIAIAAPMTLAQSRNDTMSSPPAAGADAAQPLSAAAASDRAARKSHGAFGRAMADLTQALRDASLQQAQASRSGVARAKVAADARATLDADRARANDGTVAARQAVP